MTIIRLACVGLLVLTGACADLNKLNEDACGNGVLDDGEDCDGFAQQDHIDGSPEADLTCGAPTTSTTAHRCRYTCDTTDASTCPDGWSCTSAGVCIYPSGTFSASSSGIAVQYTDWVVRDITGDAIPDVIGFNETSLDVRVGNAEGDYNDHRETTTPSRNGPPSFVDIDDNDQVDVILAIQDGLHVLRTKPDGTFDSIPFASIDPEIQYPAANYPGGIMPVVTQMNSSQLFTPFHHFAVLLDTGSEFEMTFAPPGLDAPNPFTTLPAYHPMSALKRPIPIANIDVGPGAMEEELALVFTGADRIWIYGQNNPLAMTLGLRAEVPLGGLIVDKGAKFADVDGDGSMDLLVSTSGDRVAVAYGDGTGGFAAPAVDNMFDALLTNHDPLGQLDIDENLTRWPIASADFDGDGKADYVTPQGIYITSPGAGLTQTGWRVAESPWDAAVAADFNGDGFMDVAVQFSAEDDGEAKVELLLGDGIGTFNTHIIALEGVPFQMVVGDFDGDLVTDLGIASHDTRGMGEDGIEVLFGSRDSVPNKAESMGRFAYIELIRAGSFWSPLHEIPDRNTDLLVFTNSEPDASGPHRLALLSGAPSRRMAAPFALIDRTGGSAFSPDRVIAGSYSAEGNGDAIVISDGADTAGSLWFVKGDSQGGFSDPTSLTMPASFGDGDCSAEDGLFVLADLNNDGAQQLIGFDNSAECDETGYGSSPAPKLLQASLQDQTATITGPTAVSTFTVPYQAVVHDMDGDGAADLIVTYSGEFEISMFGSLATGAGVVIYWNDDGALSVDNHVSLTLPAGTEHVIAAAAIQADDDGESELIVFTDGGLLICDLEGRAFAADCSKIELGQDFYRSSLGGERLYVADVNGDGLDDVLLGDGRNLYVAIAQSQLLGGGL